MKKSLKGIGKIFAFTFRQHTGKKSYRSGTIIGVVLCLLVPALIMAAAESFGGSDAEYIPDIREVFIVDNSIADDVDWSFLNTLGQEGLSEVSYTNQSSIEAALGSADASPRSLVVVIDESDSGYFASVLIPQESELARRDADALSGFLSSSFRYVLMQKSGLDTASITELLTPVISDVTVLYADGEQSPDEGAMSSDIEHLFSLVIGYVLVMILYFLVLIYGQGVANSVIMEKTSKLMELFLLSVDPGAMITGKVLAVALAGALQFASWAVALILSFVGGTFIVKAMNPATDMMLISIFDGIGAMSGMFSIGGIIVALLILLSGFLLYCSLSAVGGALAGKPEDLSSTNMLFTLALILSFFIVMFSGGLTGGIGDLNPAFLWIPFTGVLSAPSQLILGSLPVLAGIGVLLVTVIAALVIMFIAGKLYAAMVHHRGNPPALPDAFRMLKKN